MRIIRIPPSADITLTADVLMNTNPRALYESQTGQPRLETPVLEIRRILEDGDQMMAAMLDGELEYRLGH